MLIFYSSCAGRTQSELSLTNFSLLLGGFLKSLSFQNARWKSRQQTKPQMHLKKLKPNLKACSVFSQVCFEA